MEVAETTGFHNTITLLTADFDNIRSLINCTQSIILICIHRGKTMILKTIFRRKRK